MDIICLGLSHHTAPVTLRERLNYPPLALKAALARFGCGRGERPAGLDELVILSTCNRLELYAVMPDAAAGPRQPADESAASPVADGIAASQLADGFTALRDFIAETHELPVAELGDSFYRLAGPAAIDHLGRVACGLDSMILGEPQILGQVTEAYALALGQGACGPVLSALFQAATRAGKRARTETGISRNPASLSSVAVKLAEKVMGAASQPRTLADCQVLVVGAGEMAGLAVEALRARGAARITVVNRTQARAADLAERWGARALTFEHLGQALAEADIAISSTDAPHFVITADTAQPALAERPGRPLVLIDIAVPRDVEPEVRNLPNVHYFDIDDLEAHLNGSLAERRQAVPRVEAIAGEEMGRFSDWLSGLEVAPIIAGLRARADAIRRAEVDKTLRRLPNLTDGERQHIESMAEALVNKLLHEPTGRLKAAASNGHAADYAAAVRDLFALDE